MNPAPPVTKILRGMLFPISSLLALNIILSLP
jgi:hypothetical protein